MKRISGKASLAFYFSALFLTACQKEEQPPQADFRDLYIGQYICEVTKSNNQRGVLLASYMDTVDIVKRGEDSLAINNLQHIQLPRVKAVSQGETRSMYAAFLTVVAFENEQDLVNITHGHDSAVYELRGIKRQ